MMLSSICVADWNGELERARINLVVAKIYMLGYGMGIISNTRATHNTVKAPYEPEWCVHDVLLV